MKRLILVISFALLVLTGSGCVYYNTFFNARQAFNNAEKYRKKTGVGTQASYKTAIDKALKVIDDHPKSGYYDDALYVLGVSYYYTQQYSRADRRLRELLADYPKSKYCNDAKLYLAKTKLEIDEVDNAVGLFDEIFQGKFSKQFRAEAAMALGNYHLDHKDHDAALRYFRAVRDSLGTESQKLSAQRLIADSYFDSFKFSDALKGYLQVLGLKPDHDNRFHALYRAAISSYRLQRVPAGLDYLNQLIKDPLYYDSLGVLNLAVGEGYEAESDLDQAENVYQDIAMTSKNSAWAGEAYYRLGLIYQFDYDDLNQAKIYYDKSSGSAGGSVSGRDATARAVDIGRLQVLTKAGIDTTAIRMAREGLDSLANSEISDEDLRKELARLTVVHKKADTLSRDSLAADSSRGKADSLIARDSTSARHPDSLAQHDSTAVGAKNPSLPGVMPPSTPPATDTSHVGKDSVPAKDSSVVVKKDTVAATPPMPASTPKPPADTAAIRKDTLANKDTTRPAAPSLSVTPPAAAGQGTDTASVTTPNNLTNPRDSSRAERIDAQGDRRPGSRDSLANKDSTRNAAAKLKAAGKPKAAKDTALTREQIWKRINDAAQSVYSLAELYWFQLDKPDSAMKELGELLTLFPKSDKAPQAMVALSQMYRDYKSDTTTADSLLRAVLKQFPRSDHVADAIEALGLAGTAADTGYPRYYMRKADSFLVDAKNYDSARYYYAYVSRRFRLSQYRDQAAFNAIWVTENYLSPGDSTVYYAYKSFSDSFPSSTYAQEANKRLTYNPPPPVPRPKLRKKDDKEVAADSIMATGPNMVAKPVEESFGDSAKTYVDPRRAAFIGPKKEELILLELPPTEITVEFVYPPEAYNIQGSQFELYFQVLIDVTGRVIDYSLKIPSSSDELNRRASLTVASMRFDPLSVSSELQRKARDIVLPEDQTDPRGRWYVIKYVIVKPGFIGQ